MTQHEKEQLIHRYLKAYNTMNIPEMIAVLDPNVVFENYSGETKTHELRGKEAFEKQAIEALSYFSQRRQVPLSFEHKEEKTLVSIDYWAILNSDLPNGMKKGQELQMKGKSIITFTGSKIASIQDFA